MKSILIVSYYFPPFRGVGAKRMFSFARLLANNGYKVVVIKAQDKHYGVEVDQGLEVKIPNVKTVSVDVKNSFLRNVFCNYRIFKKAVETEVLEDRISLLFFSGGPFYYFPVGKYFKRKYSIPYILDYRDNYFKSSESIKDVIYKVLFKFLWDKCSLKEANLIINVTKKLTSLHSSENKKINKNNFITVFNGYDDSSSIKKQISENKNPTNILKIGIFGKFYYYNPRDVEVLLNSLEAVGFKVKIYHIGEKEEGFVKKVNDYGQEKNFKFIGYRSYDKGMEFLQKMDCLVLNNREDYALGTKIFDYIHLNKPIIAFTTPGSEIDRLLSSFKNAFRIYNNRDNIIKELREIFVMEDKKLDIIENNVKKYSRSYQFEKLLIKVKQIV